MNEQKKKHEEHENHERWLVSYADFITLLFAFFVVMYATSTNNQEKQKSFEKSVRVNLKLGSGSGTGQGQGEENAGQALLNSGTENKDVVIPLEGFPRGKGPAETEDYVKRYLDKKTDEDTQKKIQEIRHDAKGVRIALASAQFFNLGGIKIKVSALAALDELGKLLQQTDHQIVIEGHTDNTAVVTNSNYETNWELGALRAASLVRYFIKYHKIPAERLSAVSYADTRPLEKNDSEEGRSRNRRVEIYLILKDEVSEN